MLHKQRRRKPNKTRKLIRIIFALVLFEQSIPAWVETVTEIKPEEAPRIIDTFPNDVVVIPRSSNPDPIYENTQLYHFSPTDEEMAGIKALNRDKKHERYR